MADGQAIPDTGIDRIRLGERLRAIRKKHGWTLSDVSARTGLAPSTISKAERGQMSLTYDRFMQLAHGMNLDVSELFNPAGRLFETGGVAVTRRDEASPHETENYYYGMLCTDLRHKRMVPMLGRVKAHDIKDFRELVRHPGEEFVMVLEGTLHVHIEGREPITLNTRDSIYFDSAMGHAYVSAGDQDAVMVVVCWQPVEPRATEA